MLSSGLTFPKSVVCVMSTFSDETANALQRLADTGSDLTKPMKMDFFVAVPSESAGQMVAIKAGDLGFETSVEQDSETGDWTCYCSKILIPEFHEIVNIEKQLNAISTQYGGYIDGFGSYGNS